MTELFFRASELVVANSLECLDVMNKVTNFYDAAWTKLIWVVGVFVGLIGFVLPLFMQWLQNEKYKKDLEKQVEKLVTDIDIKYKEAVKNVKDLTNKEIKNLHDKIEKEAFSACGRTFGVQGISFVSSGKTADAFHCFLLAVRQFVRAKDFDMVVKSLNNAENLLDKISYNDLEWNTRNKKILEEVALECDEISKKKLDSFNIQWEQSENKYISSQNK